MDQNEANLNPNNMSLKFGSGMRNQTVGDGLEEIPTRDKVNQIANKYGSQMNESKISLGSYQRAQQPEAPQQNFGNSPTSEK